MTMPFWSSGGDIQRPTMEPQDWHQSARVFQNVVQGILDQRSINVGRHWHMHAGLALEVMMVH